jgi:hypothetical protein
MSRINSARSAEIASLTERLPNSVTTAFLMISERRSSGVDDPPLDKEIDLQRFLFSGEDPVRAVFDRQDSLRELANVLHHGKLEVQARLVICLHDLAELQLDGQLAFVDRKQGQSRRNRDKPDNHEYAK